ncbi:unnamed protein product [Triticum turgidum subsp. durum]|uniref:Uncharacterized protein n=1 Tax=Triticum turgidum subsp. durum TaxID=4567 RepID=A0A9R0RN86_TRITD|nr:unnamed protein product [Triticum turgidum subsp. durum]
MRGAIFFIKVLIADDLKYSVETDHIICMQIASVGSHAHAARAPEQYWKSALPNTPMPSSLSQLLNNQGILLYIS